MKGGKQREMNHKRCRTIVFCICFFAFLFHVTITSAQRRRQVPNLPKYDRQRIHFGFCLGINSSGIRPQLSDNFRNLDTVYSITPERLAGLNLGIISNLHLGDLLDLRFIPALSFSQRNLIYDVNFSGSRFPTHSLVTKTLESTYLEFPFDLKFKSKRIENYRVYVVGGIKYAIDMISQAKVLTKDKEIVKLRRRDFGYEIGVGFDFYMTYFKFSPELKMFNGLNNLLVQDNRTYSRPLKGLYSKVFLISFTFE